MADKFTEVSSQGFFSRILGSLVGFLLAPIIIIAAVVLLSWNEGRAVHAIRGLNEASSIAVEAKPSSPQPGNEGKLVHVVGAATSGTAISDPDLGIEFEGQVAIERSAEMYQWEEKKEEETRDKLGGGQETVTTYTYSKVWSGNAIDSSAFKHPEGHENPEMTIGNARYAAEDAALGGYTLDADTLGRIGLSKDLHPGAPEGWSAEGGKLYNSEGDTPAIGDTRVSYRGLATGDTISVLARQSEEGFAPFITGNGYEIAMAQTGNQPLENMIAGQRSAESLITWLLRLGGFLAMFLGFFLFLRPLSTFAAVIPFLGSIVGAAAGLVAFIVALPLTIIVIALAWIIFRPLIGIGLLLVAGAAVYGFHCWRQSSQPAVAAKAA